MITLAEVEKADKAYKQAFKTGWTQELEDICYSSGWPYDFDFSLYIKGANLDTYLNSIKNTNYEAILYWACCIINDNLKINDLISAINKSELEPGINEKLISDIENKLVMIVIK